MRFDIVCFLTLNIAKRRMRKPLFKLLFAIPLLLLFFTFISQLFSVSLVSLKQAEAVAVTAKPQKSLTRVSLIHDGSQEAVVAEIVDNLSKLPEEKYKFDVSIVSLDELKTFQTALEKKVNEQNLTCYAEVGYRTIESPNLVAVDIYGHKRARDAEILAMHLRQFLNTQLHVLAGNENATKIEDDIRKAVSFQTVTEPTESLLSALKKGMPWYVGVFFLVPISELAISIAVAPLFVPQDKSNSARNRFEIELTAMSATEIFLGQVLSVVFVAMTLLTLYATSLGAGLVYEGDLNWLQIALFLIFSVPNFLLHASICLMLGIVGTSQIQGSPFATLSASLRYGMIIISLVAALFKVTIWNSALLFLPTTSPLLVMAFTASGSDIPWLAIAAALPVAFLLTVPFILFGRRVFRAAVMQRSEDKGFWGLLKAIMSPRAV